MFEKIVKYIFGLLGLVTISGCGVYHHMDYVNSDLNNHHLHGSGYYHYIPNGYNNIQYHAPRNYLKQNINNSINISGNMHREVDVSNSRVYFVNDGIYGVVNAIDGTLNQVVVEERRKIKIPLCHSVIQSVQAVNYNSFQVANCN